MSLLFLPLLLSTPPSPDPFTSGVTYSIDCGGTANFTSEFGRPSLADRFFSAGSPAVVAEPHRFSQRQESTLRFVPPNSAGKKNCYSVPVPPGRCYLRTFTVYDNYDSKLHPPSFDVSVEGTLVFSWRSPWRESASRFGAYSDLIVSVADAALDVCFHSIATDPPRRRLPRDRRRPPPRLCRRRRRPYPHQLRSPLLRLRALRPRLHQQLRRLPPPLAVRRRLSERGRQDQGPLRGRSPDSWYQPAAQLLPSQTLQDRHYNRVPCCRSRVPPAN